MIDYYHRNHEKLQTIDKEITYYDKKITLLERFVKTQTIFNITKEQFK